MKIKVNGEEVEFETELTVSELLEKEDVEMPDMVSVELNGEILDRKDFATQVVEDGGQVEFLYFMGGGTGHELYRRTA
ncbi:sulfur carrier protein ThiS [Natroniella acetigena]|uniref:sulfur carrier protein ThiS n=1 Tax=Natroniella acetigena TaxID=52004 RepID=UPI00200A1592|nr:sulfur carrier protein ThiS [Natroniella acetigena]MCK8826150.1 sulfur carrier protein ThiS [Natroniella acetigena]